MWVLEPSLNLATSDEQFFAQALEQAHYAQGSTHPNPSVGAVLVRDGQVLSRGFTHPVGGMHAEKHALHECSIDPKGASIFVTLEPCCHTGRTPPCTDALINAGIARVVYGACDPNPLVAGQGIAQLKAARIAVEQITNPLLVALAEQSIRPFRSFIKRKRPYVTLKVATSADYAIAIKNQRTKISGEGAGLIVHKLRRAHDAIMVGANTVRIDNPKLRARFSDPKHQKQPIRIVLSSDLELDVNSEIFTSDESLTWIFCPSTINVERKQAFLRKNVEIISLSDFSLKKVLLELGVRGISSLMVEPGQKLLQSFIEEALFDELWWFSSRQMLGEAGLSIEPLLRATEIFKQIPKALPEDDLAILSGLHDF